MATMDIIKLNGGEPANFLGTISSIPLLIEMLVEQPLPKPSRKPLNSSPTIPKSPPSLSTSSVFLSHHFLTLGGIVRCDSIAKGLINTVSKSDINIPIVARLQGTNMREAQALVPSLYSSLM